MTDFERLSRTCVEHATWGWCSAAAAMTQVIILTWPREVSDTWVETILWIPLALWAACNAVACAWMWRRLSDDKG